MAEHRATDTPNTGGLLSREELLEATHGLAEHPDVLGEVRNATVRAGFAGDTSSVELIYLAATTRLLPRPVSAIVRGPSSAGKSHTIKQALAFIPPEEQIVVTGMSDKALIYLDADYRHKILVIIEAQGLSAEFTAYVVRSLLSEGRVEYVYTDFDRRTAVRITKDGPTALISSTAGRVDYELGTRVIAPNVEDTPELTRAIMFALAEEAEGADCRVDLAPFHALQRLIAASAREVRVPFARAMASATQARAVRLRRDFASILGLVRGHALLHRSQREHHDGCIIADKADYAAVYRLVATLIAEGAEQSVPKSVRQTVDAVWKLQTPPRGMPQICSAVRVQGVADELGISRPSASRRLARAESLGYIKDVSINRSGPKLFETAEVMPSDSAVLPAPEDLP